MLDLGEVHFLLHSVRGLSSIIIAGFLSHSPCLIERSRYFSERLPICSSLVWIKRTRELDCRHSFTRMAPRGTQVAASGMLRAMSGILQSGLLPCAPPGRSLLSHPAIALTAPI